MPFQHWHQQQNKRCRFGFDDRTLGTIAPQTATTKDCTQSSRRRNRTATHAHRALPDRRVPHAMPLFVANKCRPRGFATLVDLASLWCDFVRSIRHTPRKWCLLFRVGRVAIASWLVSMLVAIGIGIPFVALLAGV